MKCLDCGAELMDGARFCSTCGKPVSVKTGKTIANRHAMEQAATVSRSDLIGRSSGLYASDGRENSVSEQDPAANGSFQRAAETLNEDRKAIKSREQRQQKSINGSDSSVLSLGTAKKEKLAWILGLTAASTAAVILAVLLMLAQKRVQTAEATAAFTGAEAASAAKSLEANIVVLAVADRNDAGVVSGSGKYPQGEEVELSASPNTGYVFAGWKDGYDMPQRTVTAEENTVFVACFLPEEAKKP